MSIYLLESEEGFAEIELTSEEYRATIMESGNIRLLMKSETWNDLVNMLIDEGVLDIPQDED
jgi:hypothetical protein